MRKMSEENLFDLQIALWEKHSRQHTEIRQKIHLTTERYVTLVFALLALLNTNLIILTRRTKTIAIVLVALIMIAIVFMVIKDNKRSLQNAKIVSYINEEFGLFEKSRIIDRITLYPKNWKGWGNECWLKGSIIHILIVLIMTVLLVLSIIFQ